MKRINLIIAYSILNLILSSCNALLPDTISNDTENDTPTDVIVVSNKVTLGKSLFLDENLSLNRTMSCATCHNPDHGFIDNRLNLVDSAVSVGQDGVSLGDRNSPMVSYASFISNFIRNGNQYSGGLFYDGRANDLVEQAQGPFLNTSEMQMPSKLSVINRVLENSEYVTQFKSLYGDSIFDNTDQAFVAVADAISEFESSSEVSPFDSRFDIGSLDSQEIRGRNIFRAARCITCHSDSGQKPLFSDFSYQNLGIPVNNDVRALNGASVDEGLFMNPLVTDTNQKGHFKVPSLRNIAVTAPYMHNGVFQNLKTVVHFYNTRDVPGAINPETGQAWRQAEVSSGVVSQDVGNLGLSDSDEDDLVAFLKTLTDRKFEGL
jgi:cytochrome c peroxidase